MVSYHYINSKIENVHENPVMTFPIKLRINTELFIDRLVALYIGETLIRMLTKQDDQPVVQADWRNEHTFG